MLPVLRRRPLERDMLDAFRRDIGMLTQDISRAFGEWMPAEIDEGLTASYPVDISEKNNTLIVDAELPGFEKQDIDVSIDNGVLSIAAERRTEKKEEAKGETRHLHERRYTRVQRRFTLPSEVDESNAKVTFENGVLHLELPKVGEPKARKITID